jgi:hypothetical protein
MEVLSIKGKIVSSLYGCVNTRLNSAVQKSTRKTGLKRRNYLLKYFALKQQHKIFGF